MDFNIIGAGVHIHKYDVYSFQSYHYMVETQLIIFLISINVFKFNC